MTAGVTNQRRNWGVVADRARSAYRAELAKAGRGWPKRRPSLFVHTPDEAVAVCLARDLLPGDVLPELGWTTLSSVSQSAFGLVGLETDGGDDLAVEPDRVFQIGRELKW